MRRTVWLMCGLLLSLPTLSSTTWFVNARVGSNANLGTDARFPKRTIQAAINAASAGDVVHVASGVYYENLTLSKNLTLFGHEPAMATVNGRHAGS